MSEQQTNNPDYIQHHPDAVEDAEKAHFIANESNSDRTNESVYKHRARLQLEVEKGADYHEVAKGIRKAELNRITSALANGNITQDQAYDVIADLFYDSRLALTNELPVNLEALKWIGKADPQDSLEAVAEIAEIADKKETTASEEYDKFYK